MRSRFSPQLLAPIGHFGPLMLGVVRVLCAGLVLLGSVAAADAAALQDVNCNGIARGVETDGDTRRTGLQCVDYVVNGGS